MKDVNKRWLKNGYGYKDSPRFYNAIKKYGWDNFEHVILLNNLTQEQANIIEEYFISKYNTTDRNHGFNLRSGGLNHRHTKETKEKLSKSCKGKNCGLNNHKSKSVKQYKKSGEYIATYETITKASLSTGVNASKISGCCSNKNKTAGGYAWTYIDEDFKKIKSHKLGKKVCQYYKENHGLIVTFNSMCEAERMTGISSKNISMCCLQKRPSAGGYIWRYLM